MPRGDQLGESLRLAPVGFVTGFVEDLELTTWQLRVRSRRGPRGLFRLRAPHDQLGPSPDRCNFSRADTRCPL